MAMAGLLLAAGTAVTQTALAATPPAPASGPLPVSYDFLANAVRYGDAQNAPGENNWACRPSAAHPEPVVLVPGTAGDDADNWGTYAALLYDNGYCVYALTYGVPPALASTPLQFGGLNTIESSAGQLSTFVARVIRASGAHKVDLVGHSQGTLMPDYYVKFLGGSRYVDKYISLAPLWHGEGQAQSDAEMWQFASLLGVGNSSELPICQACTEMVGGSAFLDKLTAGGLAVAGVHYTNIVTEHDELVMPYTSGIESGMTNIVLQDGCPTDLSDHLEIASDQRASVLVLDALDPTHPFVVPCHVVLPAVG
ncbi:MAG TPA: hypothetical protein VG435_03630 [Acidimicrobiales bacterium]|nr:hypothetical protein [Acidimicrobiales bacterium]